MARLCSVVGLGSMGGFNMELWSNMAGLDVAEWLAGLYKVGEMVGWV